MDKIRILLDEDIHAALSTILQKRGFDVVHAQEEDKPGTILDYDNKGNLVSMEILDASKRVIAPSQLDYEVTPA